MVTIRVFSHGHDHTLEMSYQTLKTQFCRDSHPNI